MEVIDKSKIIKEINIRLSNIFGNNVTVLKKIMDEENIIISGLFIAECVCGDYLQNNVSIDFFSEFTASKLLDVFFKENGYKKTSISRQNILGDVESTVKIFKIKKDLSHEQNEYKINLWSTKKITKPVKIWLDNVMDFDICKNYYKIVNGEEKIYVKSYENTINKKTKFSFARVIGGFNYKYTIDKYIDYEKNGIIFINSGVDMYNYICDNAYIINKEKEHKKVYYNFIIKKCGKKSYPDENGNKKYKYVFDLVRR
ncbi:putative orfan [Tupanvirus soda lake]|uniref:Orfan n=2 Tax=Tupanvirus TaxID=2094720 RepID=A0AC62ABN9_9VIRU|nr:putative orfan [Tupanvirus soda lake]QKU35018.1 putative orfan [Tupanvirus soda lake]